MGESVQSPDKATSNCITKLINLVLSIKEPLFHNWHSTLNSLLFCYIVINIFHNNLKMNALAQTKLRSVTYHPLHADFP